MKNIYKIGIGLGILTGSYFLYKKFISMTTSTNGVNFIKWVEGVRYKAYKDSKGLWTIGVGHLILPTEKDLLTKTLTDLEVLNLLKKDLQKAEQAVNDAILIPIKQNEFDSLVSLCFNIGVNAFKGSTLARMINLKSSNDSINKAFAAWKIPFTIEGRRAKEIRLFNTGNYSNLVASTELTKYFA